MGFLSGKKLLNELKCREVEAVLPKYTCMLYECVSVHIDINNNTCSWHNAKCLLMLLTVT